MFSLPSGTSRAYARALICDIRLFGLIATFFKMPQFVICKRRSFFENLIEAFFAKTCATDIRHGHLAYAIGNVFLTAKPKRLHSMDLGNWRFCSGKVISRQVFIALLMLASGLMPKPAIADLVIVNNQNPERTVSIPESQRNDRGARQAAASSIGCILTGPGAGTFAGCTEFQSENAKPFSHSQVGARTFSLRMFDAAIGADGLNTCLSCSFLSFFMIALSDFSNLVFKYLYDIFLVLGPIMLAIWLGCRTAKLMVSGGEHGRDFLYGVTGKFALFAVVWLMATSASDTSSRLWQATGPLFLTYAFDFSHEIRLAAMGSTGTAGNTGLSSPIFCESVQVPAVNASATSADNERYGFISAALKSGCFTERAHAMGIATGIAIALDSYANTSPGYGWREIGLWLTFLVSMILKLLLGVFVTVVYAVSAIWLIFLTLDIVARGLITAAFSPLLVLAFLFKPTRGFALQAIRGLAGAMMTSIALSIVTVIAFVLITNTPKVYEATRDPVFNASSTWDGDEMPSMSAVDIDGNRIGAMRQFIIWVGEGDEDAVRIPMNLSTAWFWYMAFCGISIFALGRKIIRMLESVVGYQGAAEFANSALKSFRSGLSASVASASAGTSAMGFAGVAAAKGAGFVAGRSGTSIGVDAYRMTRDLNFGSGMHYGKNIFSNAGRAVSALNKIKGDDS